MTVADYCKRTKRQSKVLGGSAALFFHAFLFLLFLSADLYPHPESQEQGILVEFLPELQPIIPRVLPSQDPRINELTQNKDIRLVQQATQPEVVPGEVRTQASTLGETGDVELHEPPPPVTINQRALYRSRDAGDSLSDQSNRTVSATMQAGPPDGNTRQGNPDGKASHTLLGRIDIGGLPLPEYTYNNNFVDTVVVRIVVDKDGNVARQPSVVLKGTTVQNKTVWDAAIKAALKAKFNPGADDLQEGTITYVFIPR